MKKNILMLAVCTFAFFSCTNDEDVVSSNEKGNLPDITVKNGMLVFKDQSVYESTERRLNGAGISDKISFLDSVGFKSQLYIMNEADQELESLCTSESADVFSHGYKIFKEKYEGLFMFNDIEKTDLSPYCRLEQLDLSIFANNDGKFMIGDSLVKCDYFETFSDFSSKISYVMLDTDDSDISTRADEVNRAHVKEDKRKVGMYLSRTQSAVYANFTAQKKNIFGWVRYSTEYYFEIKIKSGDYRHLHYTASNGQETYVRVYPGASVKSETRELSGNITIKIGMIPGLDPASGTFEIWSRGVSYEARGIGIMAL